MTIISEKDNYIIFIL